MFNDYPEHKKVKDLLGANNTVGNFLEWLSENGVVLAKWNPDGTHLVPEHRRINDYIADFFDINEEKLEEEKRQMLANIRSYHG